MYVRNLNYVRNGTAYAVCQRDVPCLQGFCIIYIYIHIYIIYTYTHIHIRMCPPCNNQIFDLHIPKKQNETPGKKYINFSEPGLKKHHSIWCLLTLYVLVPFSVTFVLSGGLEFVSSSSFFPWLSLQKSYQGSPILLWHPIALTSHWIIA